MKQSPARTMTDLAIAAELRRLGRQWDTLGRDTEGHGGSPGEWMVERMGELETEQKRRKAPLDVPRIRQRAADLRRVSRELTMAQQRATGLYPSLLCAVVDDIDDLLTALAKRRPQRVRMKITTKR